MGHPASISDFHHFPGPVQLMLLAARTHPSVPELQQIHSLCAAPLDWDQFLAVTLHHRLSSLVFEGLTRAHPAALPAFVRQELHRRATLNAFEALRATHETARIIAQFASAGIATSVLKGVPLSQLLYGNPSTRHVGDIDLLTHPTRLFEQVEILAHTGYLRINPPCRLTPRRLASFHSFWKDFTFESPVTGFALDLHWRLFNNRFHAGNRILTHAEFTTITPFDHPVRVLSPIDQFLYVAAHGLADAWIYLKSLADVAAFLKLLTPEQLNEALLRAEALGLLAHISAAIHLSNDWMGSQIAHPRLLPASDPLARDIRGRTTETLLRHNFQPHRSHPSPTQWLQLETRLVPGYRSSLELIRRFVWRPRVWASFDLTDRWFWLYPLLGLILPPRAHTFAPSLQNQPALQDQPAE